MNSVTLASACCRSVFGAFCVVIASEFEAAVSKLLPDVVGALLPGDGGAPGLPSPSLCSILGEYVGRSVLSKD